MSLRTSIWNRRTFLIAASLVFLSLVTWDVAWQVQAAREKRRFEREIRGLSVKRVAIKLLMEAHSLELIALDPNERKGDTGQFHGYVVLGRAESSAAAEIEALADAYLKGVLEPARYKACFEPRHGIHLSHAGRELDLVICFECGRSEHYLDKLQVQDFPISVNPRVAFNKIFTNAGLSISK